VAAGVRSGGTGKGCSNLRQKLRRTAQSRIAEMGNSG
jgi:hypothetical protein